MIPYTPFLFPGLGLVSGQLLALRTSLDSSVLGSTGNVTVIVTATGGTATATGGDNTNNDNDTNTATNNTGRRMMNQIERVTKKIMSFLQRLSFSFKRNLFEQTL